MILDKIYLLILVIPLWFCGYMTAYAYQSLVLTRIYCFSKLYYLYAIDHFQFMPQETSSKCFSSSRTSRITLVDLAGPDRNKLEEAGRQCVKEGKNVKKSVSQLGYDAMTFPWYWSKWYPPYGAKDVIPSMNLPIPLIFFLLFPKHCSHLETNKF